MADPPRSAPRGEDDAWAPAAWLQGSPLGGDQQPGNLASHSAPGRAPGGGPARFAAEDFLAGKYGGADVAAMSSPSLSVLGSSDHGRSPAHLSGAATPSKEHGRVIGSIGPPNLTTFAQRPQGPGSVAADARSLFKPVGLPAQHQEGKQDEPGGSNLINLDASDSIDSIQQQQQQRGRRPMMTTQQQQQQMLQIWAPNTSGGVFHGSEQLLDDMTDRMANMNMNQMQQQMQQQQSLKSKQMSAVQASMMRASMPPQVMQQQPQQQQRSGPSKLSMMTNQQLMMLAQTDMPPSKGYKTVLCKFWEINMCAKGSACTFAHGAEELERFTSSRPAGFSSPSPLKLDLYKTQLCLFHMQSRCSKGTLCPYAHGMSELRATAPHNPSEPLAARAPCPPASGMAGGLLRGGGGVEHLSQQQHLDQHHHVYQLQHPHLQQALIHQQQAQSRFRR